MLLHIPAYASRGKAPFHRKFSNGKPKSAYSILDFVRVVFFLLRESGVHVDGTFVLGLKMI